MQHEPKEDFVPRAELNRRRSADCLQRVVGRHATHNCPMPYLEGGKIAYFVDKRDVIVMAIVGGYAMVRRPHCVPYVANASEIEVPSNESSSGTRR